MNQPNQPVEEYLAKLSPEVVTALEKLRKQIKAVAPEATESISYGIPMFKYKGRPLVSFGAAKAHCSFYIMSTTAMEKFASELKEYSTTKGAIHFTINKPIPEKLVVELVKARMGETDKLL